MASIWSVSSSMGRGRVRCQFTWCKWFGPYQSIQSKKFISEVADSERVKMVCICMLRKKNKTSQSNIYTQVRFGHVTWWHICRNLGLELVWLQWRMNAAKVPTCDTGPCPREVSYARSLIVPPVFLRSPHHTCWISWRERWREAGVHGADFDIERYIIKKKKGKSCGTWLSCQPV
jgi:hypothetical protein